MGVAGLWDVIRPAGKLRSLTHLSITDGFEANPDGKRGFRVGIDASIWFYHATYGREGENPELRTLFFRCTRLMEKPILPLFVFDGPKRPEVKRGKRISGKNHWMVQGMQEIISAFGFEWRMAPGEAEAELAYLNRIGVIDAVLSDDVDTFLFGAKMVVRNPSTNLSGNRAHSMKNAAGKDDGNHVMTYAAADFSRDDIQLTQGGLILIGVLRGGDYSDGLERCGVATAHGLAKAGFGDTLLNAARTLSRDGLEDFLVGWRQDIRNELRTNSSGRLQRKSPSLAKAIPEDFPNIDVLLAYTNPVTSEAKGPGHKNAVVDWDKEPDLGRIAGLCEMYFEWGVKEIIIKRFRNVLWPSAVLRILRRAALIKDREAAALVARNPQTPRKSGKAQRAPPGTPSSMITKHFAKFTLNTPGRNVQDDDDDADGDEDSERLIVKIHSSRRHASTDDVLEYRLEIAPAQLVRLCEAGIRGLRTSLPPSLSDEDDGDEDEDEECSGKKGKKTSKPPPAPDSHLRIWMPACMVEIVEPELVDEFEGVEQQKAEKKAAKGT
ncbi:PIN domain-like protein, partial [Daedaleopsis nitida]